MNTLSWALTQIESGHKEMEVESYLLFKTAKNKLIMGWTPTQEDIFAEDYVVNATP